MSTLRFLTAGESHGVAEVAILEGMPSGLSLSHEDINRELQKRMHDFGRGGRAKIEKDEVKILSGVRMGKTIGSPIALIIDNLDQAKWEEKVTSPRPGHADLTGVLKYGFDDVRNVLERASARETVARVAIGAVCKKLLLEFGTEIASHTLQIGKAKAPQTTYAFEEIKHIFQEDPDVHCVDKNAREKMKQEILNARIDKDTLGGVVEIIAHNIPIGLGSHVHFDRKLDGRIAQALMSIPSVKAVEIGNAIDACGKTGSQVQDRIYVEKKHFYRKTNNMGGVEGGISNGEDIVCRVYHKPLSTLYDPLETIDITTRKASTATVERSDVSVVARGGVVSESVLAFVLAQAILEKFGGDSISETKRNFASYQNALQVKHKNTV